MSRPDLLSSPWIAHTAAVTVALTLILNGGIMSSLAQDHASLEEALADQNIKAALRSLDNERTTGASYLVQISEIQSPSGRENRRAEKVAELMRAIGLQNVSVDNILSAPTNVSSNVSGIIPGAPGNSYKSLVFISTLDDIPEVTGYQRDAGHAPRIEGDKVIGPGSSDSLPTAAMLIAAKSIVDHHLVPKRDLIFAAVAQEETCLGGMKRLYADLKDHSAAFVDVLGAGHTIWDGAITIHWWWVIAHGPEGHTLGGGVPNTNQGIARAVDQILQLPEAQSADVRTAVVNVAMLQSGEEFNKKPAMGKFSIDIRSTDPTKVSFIEQRIRAILKEVSAEVSSKTKQVTFEMQQNCLEEGGAPLSADPVAIDLVKTSTEIARNLLVMPTTGDCPLSVEKLVETRKLFGEPASMYSTVPYINGLGSSNMNVAIAGGTPAIGIWSEERGGNWHTPDEWACIPTLVQTAKHIFLLAATVGGAR